MPATAQDLSEEAVLAATIRRAARRLCELDCAGGVMDLLSDVRFEIGEGEEDPEEVVDTSWAAMRAAHGTFSI